MIKVIVQQNGKKEKEMKFKYANKALDFMYMCPSKGMFILGYYGESELDDCDIWWLNNRINLSSLNTRCRNYYRKEESR